MKKLSIMIGLLGLAIVMLSLGVEATPTGAADHLDAPLVSTDGQIDINDIYAFQSPHNVDNTVLIMTVNPLAGVQSPTTFRVKMPYIFRIDNDGDAKPDTVLKVRFGEPNEHGAQKVKVRLVRDEVENEDEHEDEDKHEDENEKERDTLFKGWTGENIPMKDGDGMFHAGVFDDPFFFDLVAFRDGLNFCPDGVGTDFFAGLNVSAIVMEIPAALLTNEQGDPNIGVWGFIKADKKRVERMGRPAINTVFIPSDQKDAFNKGKPHKDQKNFRDEVVATLLALGNDEATANALADVLLPDILTFDTSSSAGFLNGRKLADDVIDAELALISGGGIPTDCVDSNDKAFSNEFPYLASPH